MPSIKSRDRGPIRLRVSTRTVRPPADRSAAEYAGPDERTIDLRDDGPPLLPWPIAAIGGGVLAALAGSLAVAGVVLIAWLSAIAIPLPTALTFATQVWLLAHGGAVQIGADQWTVVPLGLTLIFAAICASVGGFAFRQGRQARAGEVSAQLRRRLVLGSVAQVTAGYTAFAALLAWGLSGPAAIWRPALGALLVSGIGSVLGAATAAGHRPNRTRPEWLRRGLRGAAAGGLALVAAAAVALGVALLLGESQVTALEESLRFDSGGVFVWSLIALAYLPSLLAWTLAWVLGAGFTVGAGSLVSLWTTELGMLPAVPVFGALPPVGVASPWLLAWLGFGVVAGGLAGVVAVRGRRTGPLGALAASAAAGALLVAFHLAWAGASRGSLGSMRLAGLGPRLLESVLIGAPLLLFSSLLAGLLTWFVRRRGPASDPPAAVR